VLYLRDKYWVVVDHFEPDGEREVQVLWHYAPTCEVVLQENEALSINSDQANLRIVPIGSVPWQVQLVSGQEEPFIQGWYSADYGSKEPNTAVVYEASIDQPVTFAWLLIPANGQVPKSEANLYQTNRGLGIAINQPDQNPATISFPSAGPPEVSDRP
jgi:hypothetical protein